MFYSWEDAYDNLKKRKKKKKGGLLSGGTSRDGWEKAEAGRKIVPRDKYSIVMRKTSLRNMICPILLRIDEKQNMKDFTAAPVFCFFGTIVQER